MAALVSSMRHAVPAAAAAEVMIVNVAQLLYALLSFKRVLFRSIAVLCLMCSGEAYSSTLTQVWNEKASKYS
jgi:hypothetical protein